MRAGVPCAPIQSVPQALAHPHTAHREMVVRIGDAYAGVALPIKLSHTRFLGLPASKTTANRAPSMTAFA